MAKGLYNRIKRWVRREALNYDDLNAEFDNVINNQIPTKVDDYSETLTQMRTQTDPGESGTESQATSLAGEIERLRNQLAEITGKTYWYQSPTSSIETLNTKLNSFTAGDDTGIVSGREDANGQPMFLRPAGSSAQVNLDGSPTSLVVEIGGTQYTVSSDLSLSSLLTAPSTNNTCLVNDADLSGQASSKWQGERTTAITIDTIGSEISSLNGTTAAFKVGSTDYFTAFVDTSNNQLINCQRGFFFDSSDNPNPRVAISNNDTITLLKLAWVFVRDLDSTPALAITYTGPTASGTQPGSPTLGDYWYDLGSGLWKRYNGTSFEDVKAVFVGNCIMDSTNCVAARSADLNASYSDINSIDLQYLSASIVQSKYAPSRISVYGQSFLFKGDRLQWDITADLDTGSEASSTTYYAYIDRSGDRYLSIEKPSDRSHDLLGEYHPYKPWRFIGQIDNNGSSNFDSDTVISAFRDIDGERVIRQTLLPVTAYRSAVTGTGTYGEIVTSTSGPNFPGSIFSTNSTSPTAVTNLTLTITTSGNPVFVELVYGDTTYPTAPENGTSYWEVGGSTGVSGFLSIKRDSTHIKVRTKKFTVTSGTFTHRFDPSFYVVDYVAAGTYTYTVNMWTSNGTYTHNLSSVRLRAFEIF